MYERKSILLATPCYGNQMLRGYFHSVLKLQDLCRAHNIDLEISTIGNESLITRARNYFVSLLLSEPKYTHLLFIDSDITFDPNSVIRMVQADKDVVAGAYPKKSVNWEKVRELAANPSIATEFLEPMAHDYALNVLTRNDMGSVSIPIVNGFMKVSYVATGFVLIKRHVFDTMVKVHPEWKYVNDVSGYDTGKNKDCFYSCFDCIIDPDTKRYLSEDYAFCNRWLALGGEIWLDLLCNLNHTGSYDFKGSYYRIIEHLLNEQKKQQTPTTPLAPTTLAPPVVDRMQEVDNIIQQSTENNEVKAAINNIKEMLKNQPVSDKKKKGKKSTKN